MQEKVYIVQLSWHSGDALMNGGNDFQDFHSGTGDFKRSVTDMQITDVQMQLMKR